MTNQSDRQYGVAHQSVALTGEQNDASEVRPMPKVDALRCTGARDVVVLAQERRQLQSGSDHKRALDY
jgi:hypothetical protein